MDYGVTPKGFVPKRFDTILEEVQEQASTAFGFNVRENQQSLLNAGILYPFCDKLAEAWEMGQKNYDAKYPSSAEGISLDNACEYGNIRRKGNVPTEYVIHVTAKEGIVGNPTVIPKNSIISSITNPVVNLRCARNTTITRDECNGIAVKPVVETAGTYTIELNGTFYSYTAGESDTKATIVQGLYDAFTDEGYTKSIEEDGKYLVIVDNETTGQNAVALSSNLTTEYVISLVHYMTESYGEIDLPNETITAITSNVTGMISVVNKVRPVFGRTEQSDTELRQDYFRKSYANSSRQTEAMESAILDDVDNVASVRCYENRTDYPDEMGRPPHSIEVIVDGGEVIDIATKIQQLKAGGIATFGSIVTEVSGEQYGDAIKIRFNRPDIVYAWMKVTLTRGQNASIDPDYVDIVKEYILSATEDMTIGDSLLSQKLINGIYGALSGITYCRIQVAVGTDATTQPAAASYAEGNIPCTQRQKIEIVGGRIEVVLA